MSTISYEEALNACIAYFKGDGLAAKTVVDKYLLRDRAGNLLEKEPTQMFRRFAREFARIEKKKFKKPLSEDDIYALLDGFKYIVLQGSPMYGLGNKYQYVSLANCYVLPPPRDSYLGILYTDTQITQIACRRGGSGWDDSKLRPVGFAVKNAAKTTSGMVEFAKRFSNTIREVGQHGRRGASLQSSHVKHPEIFKFITVKREPTAMTGSNISVQFTDEFMEAVKNDKEFELCWPISESDAKEIGLPVGSVRQKIKAKDLWKEFVYSAWLRGEPGCMFIDRVHEESPGYPYGQIESSSNPCGEQYLPPYASCRLVALNLFSYVKNPFTKDAEFDFALFQKHAALMQRLADDLVDLDIEKVDEIIAKIKSDPEPPEIKQIGLDLWLNIKKTSINDRRTGCGFTGFADAVAALGKRYGGDSCIEFATQMQKSFKEAAYRSSVEMAKELGAFPLYNAKLDIKSKFIQRLAKEFPELYEDMEKYGRRNMVLLTIAPTGSISILTQTSSGVEPVFKLSYTRRKKGNPGDIGFKSDFVDATGDHWMHFDVYHHGLIKWAEIAGKKPSDIEDSPYYKSTANEIDWMKKVELQAALQKHVDNSISNTLNLPQDVSETIVSHAYMKAWELGCKGITVYRDKCRDGVLVDKDSKAEASLSHTHAPKRPKMLPCVIHHVSVKKPEGKRVTDYLVFVGLLEGVPYEVFAMENGVLDKSEKIGGITKEARGKYVVTLPSGKRIENITKTTSDAEDSLTRMVSCSLRHGAEISFVVQQLEKAEGDMFTFSKAMARALKKHIKDGTLVVGDTCRNMVDGKVCGGELFRQEGCPTCKSCGWSKC